MNKRLQAIVLLSIFLAVLLGCGNDGGDSEGESPIIMPDDLSSFAVMEQNASNSDEADLIDSSVQDGDPGIQDDAGWSGLRWVDLTGRIIREHSVDATGYVHFSEMPELRRILIYQLEQALYLRDTGTDIEEETIIRKDEFIEDMDSGEYRELMLYTLPDETGHMYVVANRQVIYRVNQADGAKQMLYTSDRAIYGIAPSPDGTHIAILVDSERIHGPYADLIVSSKDGQVISEFAKASFISHSDGLDFIFIYPVAWEDDERVVVPWRWHSDEPFERGRALYHFKKGFIEKQGDERLSEDDLSILRAVIGEGWDQSWVVRVLPHPSDEERYAAVSLSGFGTYLIDRVDKTALPIGTGVIMAWTSDAEMLVWHSDEERDVMFIGID